MKWKNWNMNRTPWWALFCNGAMLVMGRYFSDLIHIFFYWFAGELELYKLCPLQVFSSWMHFCAVRVFTESIMRYGLPSSFLVFPFLFEPWKFLLHDFVPYIYLYIYIKFYISNFETIFQKIIQAVVASPPLKSEKKVRSVLESFCDNANRLACFFHLFHPLLHNYRDKV